MTHDEMLNEFTTQGFKEGTTVCLKLKNGTVVNGKLSYGKVMCEVENGEKINSRIGLIVLGTDSILDRVKPSPFYTNDIAEISLGRS